MFSPAKPRRHLIIVIGQPGVGKSTFLRESAKEFSGYQHISRDDIYAELNQAHMQKTGISFTTDEAYCRFKKEVDEIYFRRMREAIDEGRNIVLERPHNTPETRRESLEIAKNSARFDYKTTAIVIAAPDEETHIERLVTRAIAENKFISLSYVSLNDLHPPKQGDGEFDEVIVKGQPSAQPLFHEYGKTHVNLLELIAGNHESDKNRTR